MSSHVIAHISPAAMQHNLQVVKQHVGKSQVLAMIKANAYGHGLVPSAKALAAADAFGVARLEEAEVLRAADIKQPIVVMAGFSSAAELKKMIELNVASLIFNEEQISLLETQELSAALEVWLKMDSGMHRLGFTTQTISAAYERLQRCKNILKPLHFLSHFSCADQPDSPVTAEQIKVFLQSIPGQGSRSIANSAPILTMPQTHLDWVRPGIMLYGISPFPEQTGLEWNLQPAMTLSSVLIDRKSLRKGDRVGYGGLWSCPEDMPIGVAAIGYGDGYPRHARNGTPVLVGGRLCGLAGRVSMDFISIDLRNNPEAKVGDSVILWGRNLPIEQVALAADTIAYELTCRLTRRVVFVEEYTRSV